jgi:hypothetical protein
MMIKSTVYPETKLSEQEWYAALNVSSAYVKHMPQPEKFYSTNQYSFEKLKTAIANARYTTINP